MRFREVGLSFLGLHWSPCDEMSAQRLQVIVGVRWATYDVEKPRNCGEGEGTSFMSSVCCSFENSIRLQLSYVSSP